ncbi:MAG: FAD-binding oxidoreductase [Betaproteobacteria bacterium]|nr:FAD-binding oxidoreductase [Betaproteobacteria bacterium]
MQQNNQTEVLIAGAGIAGASAAYFLSPHCRVTILEREDQPGYHTTGRSAALFAESYGNATVRALTRASRAFLESPPAGFATNPILSPRGHLVFGRADQGAALDAIAEDFAATGARVQALSGSRVRELVPALREEHAHRGVLDESAQDIDVHALHHGFLRGARANGARLVTSAEIRAAQFSNGRWRIETSAGEFDAALLVNAAGAWVDELARACGAAPIGIEPLRRTAIVFECGRFSGGSASTSHWPLAIDATETLYFRPEAGRFLASPADETPSPPCDAQPDEFDVATLVERLQAATHFDIRRITSKWAGLRSFVADRTLVAGFDVRQAAFFWLAGQGGYGIQTSPAMGMAAAALVLRREMPAALRDEGVSLAALDPRRLV